MSKVKLAPAVPADGQPVAAGDDKAVPPPFGTPVPAGSGDLPRVVPELARAGRGETRYKVALRLPGDTRQTRYVLAATGDRKGAEAAYLKAEGLDALPPGGALAVTELRD